MKDGPKIPPEKVSAFLFLVGRAITEWARIEEQLYLIVDSILKTDSLLSAVVFYRTPTTRARITLTDDLVKTLYPKKKSGDHDPPGLINWGSLRSDISTELNLRNRIAHHQFGPIVKVAPAGKDSPLDLVTTGPAEPGIHMPLAEANRERTADLKVLDRPAIEAHIKNSVKLTARLQEFRENELKEQLQSRAEQRPSRTQS